MRSGQLRALAEATPRSRDRTVDLVRAAAIAVVVVGHWLTIAVQVEDGRLTGDNVLGLLPWTHPVTWAAQVMPLFFVVGGWAAAASWRSGRAPGERAVVWLHRRLDRLLRPTTVLVLAGAGVAALLRMLGADRRLVELGAWVVALALWFLVVYLAVTAAVPLLVAAHERAGLAVPAGLTAATAGIELLRFGPALASAPLTWATVWLCFAALGVAWQAGALGGRWPAALAVGGLGSCAALVALGPWPLSMLNVPGADVQNVGPPSLALLALGAGHCGLVLLAAPRLARLAARRRVWTATVAVNTAAMTLYLWHLVPVALVTPALVLSGVLPAPAPGTASWWLTRPLWLGALGAVLLALVVLVRRFELPRPAAAQVPRRGGALLVVAGIAAAGAGLVQLTLGGLNGAGPAGLPLPALACYLLGVAAVRASVRAPAGAPAS